MRPGLSRRETLALGLGATGALIVPAAGRRPQSPRSIEDLSLAFRETPRDEVFGVAAAALRAGATRETLLGAVFRAGIEDVRPRPHGILHCVMEVESNFQLAGAAPSAEAWLPALFNLDDFKVSQARDVRDDGDWKLPPRADVTFATEGAARRELHAAMEVWDPERADRAVVGLLPFHDHDSMFEILWPYGIRCNAFIGHKVIYVAQIERTLRRIGWDQAEPALRSLVLTVLVERSTEDYDSARALAGELDDDWAAGERDPAASAAMLRALRTASPAEAQQLVIDALQAGHHPDSSWDALRLLGSELFLRRPGLTAAAGRDALLPVHGVTIPNALGYIYRTTREDEIRRLALLQAAAWTARMRVDLARMVGLSMEGPGIDHLADEARAPASLSELLAAPQAATACALLDEQPELASAYGAALRSSLFRRGVEHHQHKYTAAALEDAALVHPRWRSRLLAAGIEYVATPTEPDSEVYRRSLAALRKAGVL